MDKYTVNNNFCICDYCVLHFSAPFGHHQLYLSTKIKYGIKYNEVC